MPTYSSSLAQLCCGEGRTLQKNTAGICGECSQWIDHTGLPQPKVACTSQVQASQALRCAVRTQSQVSRCISCTSQIQASQAPGAPRGHSLRYAVCLVHLPGPSSSGSRVCCEHTVAGGPCISSGELVPSSNTPSQHEPSRIPGRCD